MASVDIGRREPIPQPPIPVYPALPRAPLPNLEPPIRPQWDWRNPSLRAQLRPGTLLESWDCGYLRVWEVRPEGIVLPHGIGPGRVMAWAEMTKLELMIYAEPAEGEDWRAALTPPLLRELGGRLELPSPAVLCETDELARARFPRREATLGITDLTMSVVAEIVRLAAKRTDSIICLRASWAESVDRDPLPEVELRVSDAETIDATVTLTARLALLASVLRNAQGIGPSALEMDVWRDEHGTRFEVRYSYAL